MRAGFGQTLMYVFFFFHPADMSEGTVGNMTELGITESFQVKRQVLLSASEAAEMILRVDNIIKAAPRSVHHTCLLIVSVISLIRAGSQRNGAPECYIFIQSLNDVDLCYTTQVKQYGNSPQIKGAFITVSYENQLECENSSTYLKHVRTVFLLKLIKS